MPAWISQKALNRAVQEERLINVPPIMPGRMGGESDLAIEEFGASIRFRFCQTTTTD